MNSKYIFQQIKAIFRVESHTRRHALGILCRVYQIPSGSRLGMSSRAFLEHVLEMDRNCFQIVFDIVQQGEFATIDAVLGVLLQRYGVATVNELMVGSLLDFASISLVLAINRQV